MFRGCPLLSAPTPAPSLCFSECECVGVCENAYPVSQSPVSHVRSTIPPRWDVNVSSPLSFTDTVWDSEAVVEEEGGNSNSVAA